MAGSLIGSPYSRADSDTNFNISDYGDNPWANLTTNERLFYDPVLRYMYRQKAVFGQYINFQQNLANRKAKNMQITSTYDLHPDFNRIGLRDMSLPSSHIDSRAQQITFERYGGKIAYMDYDEIN